MDKVLILETKINLLRTLLESDSAKRNKDEYFLAYVKGVLEYYENERTDSNALDRTNHRKI